MNTKHTALPWHTNLRSHPSDQVFSDDLIVADCKWTNHTPDVREANSEFIVRACNAHDELVAALQNILTWDDGSLPGDILDEAQRVLAKARGE